MQALGLTAGEALQVCTLSPSSLVEVHLLVENCKERMTGEQVEAMM